MDGVFLGGEGQESTIGLRPLDRNEPGDTGRLLVPVEMLDADDPKKETIGKVFLLKCAKCGNIKKSRFRFDV